MDPELLPALGGGEAAPRQVFLSVLRAFFCIYWAREGAVVWCSASNAILIFFSFYIFP